REEAKAEAQRYLEECVEWSQKLENNERAKSANQLLRRVQLLSQTRIQCPRCKKSFQRGEPLQNYGDNPVAEVMKCRVCGVLYCWPQCCKLHFLRTPNGQAA